MKFWYDDECIKDTEDRKIDLSFVDVVMVGGSYWNILSRDGDDIRVAPTRMVDVDYESGEEVQCHIDDDVLVALALRSLSENKTVNQIIVDGLRKVIDSETVSTPTNI